MAVLLALLKCRKKLIRKVTKGVADFFIALKNRMTETMKLNGATYLAIIKGGAANLNAERAEINDLNVFPVPDGDTGDNMYMTIQAGIAATEENDSVGKVANAIAHGMLLGARGNSGVILSRIFFGIAEGLKDIEEADTNDFIHALKSGIKEAYSAVSVPVEGTILTVYRQAVEAIDENSGNLTIEEVLKVLCDAAAVSLKHTPELLDVLKNAGVVDSGGAGILSILNGMLMTASGNTPIYEENHTDTATKLIDLNLFTEDSELEYGYCTEFLLRLQRRKVNIADFDMENFKKGLEALGNSMVVFMQGTIIKAHIHTFTPWQILEYAQRYGEFLTMKIENMSLQHSDSEKKNAVKKAVKKPHKPYGTVAVAMGDGIKEAFLSMGADAVVGGGQCSNPSAQDFIEAFESVNADTIFVFPGDSNIILTAKQAGELYNDSEIIVVPCRSIGEIYAALSVYDTSAGDAQTILNCLQEEIENAVSGSVSRASRDTDMNGVTVRKDDFIGYSGNTVLSDNPCRETALLQLAEKLNAKNYDVLLLICGEATTDEETERVYQTLSETYKRTEIIMMNGGQPIQDYILLLQ